MIHSAIPIVSPVANIVFLDLKNCGPPGRLAGRTTCAKTMIPTGRDFGLAEWIKDDRQHQTLETQWNSFMITSKLYKF